MTTVWGPCTHDLSTLKTEREIRRFLKKLHRSSDGKSLLLMNDLTSVVDQDIEGSSFWLSPLNELDHLVIENDTIRHRTGRQLERLLSSGMKSLILEHVKLSRSSVLPLANGLGKELCTLNKLVLRHCSLNNHLLELLAQGLKHSRSIQELSFEGNAAISDPTSLAEILPTITSIRYLSLNHCSVSHRGLHALLKAVKRTPSLTTLKVHMQNVNRTSDKNLYHAIYFYTSWNSIEGWKLWKASDGIFAQALSRLAKNQNLGPSMMFLLLRSDSRICFQEEQEQSFSRKRTRAS